MWLAVLLGCTSPAATSCDVLVRTEGLIATEKLCQEEVAEVAKALAQQGMYVHAKCFKLTVGSTI